MKKTKKSKFGSDKNSELLKLRQELARLKKLSEYDSLTGVLNRRGFLAHAKKIFNRAKYAARKGQHSPDKQFALLFADIDNFKRINDIHTHETGDAVLKFIAHQLYLRLRGYDILARWGGEEFVMLILGVHRRNVSSIAEDIRKLIETSCLRYRGKKLFVTVSVGATCFHDQKNLETIIRKADRAMYYVKTHGRNGIRVVK